MLRLHESRRNGNEGPRLAPGLALIFDMDGVLIDSNPAHRQAWVEFNQRFGLETTEAMQQRMYGRRNDEIIRDFFGDGLTPEEVAARSLAKEELFRKIVGDRVESLLVPGVREFLAHFNGVPLGLASNAEIDNITFVLDRANLRGHFQVVLDGSRVENPKPHPDIYLQVAELLRVKPGNCIVFEDSRSGVRAALQAGMRVIGLSTTDGYLPGTSLTIDNFQSRDLYGWLTAQQGVD